MQACGEAASVTDEMSGFCDGRAVWIGIPPGPGFGMRAPGSDGKVFGAGARWSGRPSAAIVPSTIVRKAAGAKRLAADDRPT